MKILVDGFLKDVGEQLGREGKSNTRVIVVEPDGSWVARVEEEDDVGSERSTPEVEEMNFAAKPVVELGVVGQQMGRKKKREKKEMVVIDLCEDD
jgi:hypothetical protein